MTVAYVPSSGSTLVPAVMPPACVHASRGDPACVLLVHHVRERKAGPQIPVTVVQCRTHRRAFTLYPLGHVPYGRLAVAPVALDGQVRFSSESEPTAADRRPPAWRATQLGAAFAALDDSTVKLTDRRWWATQTPERLAQSAALLGVHPGLPMPDADAIAFRLEVPRLVLRQAADHYAQARGRAARGPEHATPAAAADPPSPLPGRWVWPVKVYQGRRSVITNPWSTRPERIHKGVDILFPRVPGDTSTGRPAKFPPAVERWRPLVTELAGGLHVDVLLTWLCS